MNAHDKSALDRVALVDAIRRAEDLDDKAPWKIETKFVEESSIATRRIEPGRTRRLRGSPPVVRAGQSS